MATTPLDQFLETTPPDFAAVVQAVDEAVRAAAPLDAAIKWRQLCYGWQGDFHHWICAIAVSKKRITLNFHFGALLDDPEGAFRAGTSRFMRMLDFESVADVDSALIARRVQGALARLEHFKAHWREL